MLDILFDVMWDRQAGGGSDRPTITGTLTRSARVVEVIDDPDGVALEAMSKGAISGADGWITVRRGDSKKRAIPVVYSHMEGGQIVAHVHPDHDAAKTMGPLKLDHKKQVETARSVHDNSKNPEAIERAKKRLEKLDSLTRGAEAPLRIEKYTDKSVIVRGDMAKHKDRIRDAWPAGAAWSDKEQGWIFSAKREGLLREKLADLLTVPESGEAKTGKRDEGKEKEPPATAVVSETPKPETPKEEPKKTPVKEDPEPSTAPVTPADLAPVRPDPDAETREPQQQEPEAAQEEADDGEGDAGAGKTQIERPEPLERPSRVSDEVTEPADGTKGRGSRREHQDVGEKFGGARKDTYAKIDGRNLDAVEELGALTAAKMVTKARVFEKPEHEANKALGDEPAASAMKQALWSTVASTPSLSGMNDRMQRSLLSTLGKTEEEQAKALRAAYVAGCSNLSRRLATCRTLDEVKGVVEYLRDIYSNGGEWLEERELTPEDRKMLVEKYKRPGRPADDMFINDRIGDTHTYHSSTAAMLSGVDGTRLDTDAMVRDGVLPLRINGKTVLRHYNTDPKARIDMMVQSLVLGKRYIDGPMTRVSSSWRNTGYDIEALHKKGADKGWEELTGVETEGQKVERKKRERFVLEKTKEAPVRIGGAPIPDTVVGPDLMNKFGLRGVEYGNWVSDKGAEAHLANAYGALQDLADVLKIAPTQISHGKTLGLAFGARGSGAARAHYEPDRKVINLTHVNGAGTIAHEWGHFLDHLVTGFGAEMGRQSAAPTSMVSQTRRVQLPAAVRRAADEVQTAIYTAAERNDAEIAALKSQHRDNQRALYAESAKSWKWTPAEREQYNNKVQQHNEMGKRIAGMEAAKSKFLMDSESFGANYWASSHELFARAFESYVQDRLEQQGRKNTYLVSGTTQPMETGRDVYPRGKERERINAAMDKLFDALRQEDLLKKGMSAFFSADTPE